MYRQIQKYLIFSFLLTFFFPCMPSGAEDVRSLYPDAVQKRATDTQEYYKNLDKVQKEEAEEDQGDGEESVPETPSKKPAVEGKKILVKQLNVDESEVLEPEDINRITDTLKDKEVTLEDIQAAVRQINELYKSKKFIAARAYLPPQKVEEGIVTIKLIEGKIGKILVEGNKTTGTSFIRKRISLDPGEVVDFNKLEKDLAYFNSVYDVQLRAELKAGAEVGTTDCVLKVFEEPERFELSAFTDNAGREDVGLYRLGVVGALNSLLGRTDHLSAGIFWAEGTMSYSAYYDVPINRKGTRIGVSYDQSQIEVVSGTFESLNIDGDSSDIGVYLNHPFIGKPAFKLKGFLGGHMKESETRFEDSPLVDTSVQTIEAGFDVQSFDEKGMWYTRHSLTGGDDDDTDTQFIRYNGDISRLQVMKEDVLAIFRASGQFANENLIPTSEQFQVGGMSTVRGYSEGILIGDGGYLLSAELNFPIFKKGHKLRKKIKGAVFLDHGGAFPYKPEDVDIDGDNFITSAGFGFNIEWSKWLSGRVNFAVPFTRLEDDQGNFKVHFYFQSRLF